MKKRPLCYQEENTEDKLLTLNILIRGKYAVLLQEDIEIMGETQITKRLKFVKQCKNNLNK